MEQHENQTYDEYGSFNQQYCCFPLSYIMSHQLQEGNRIIMPPSALDRLVSLNIEYPMIFEIRNPSSGRASHCGVLEFSAEEGLAFLPDWMMKNLQLQEGQLVELKCTSLPKGTYMKIQPHTMNFIGLRDPKAVLETTLRHFSCLTIGDTIRITHEHNQYYIDILETKPSKAISVVETDCEVDFAPPLDYKEPEKKAANIARKSESDHKVKEGMGKEEAKFKPFRGVGRRLDGEPPSTPAAVTKEDRVVATDGVNTASGLNCRSRKRSGKFVLGSEDASEPPRKSTKVSKEDVEERILNEDQHKFQPFTGKKNILGGRT